MPSPIFRGVTENTTGKSLSGTANVTVNQIEKMIIIEMQNNPASLLK